MNGYKRGSSAGAPTVDLNRTRYRELVAAERWGTQEAQAKGIGVSQKTISRVVEFGWHPGPKMIASLLITFPDESFNRLFNIVERRPTARLAQEDVADPAA